nr:LLM class flavin-dependent oxidoreductase [Actinomadura terrae]
MTFVGYIGTSRSFGVSDNTFDLDHVREATLVHEKADYDSVLIGYGAGSPDPTQVAAYAAHHSERIRFLIAHRPGLMYPTLAARLFASVDHFTEGRIDLNIVAGHSDADQRREGDFLSKDERYVRSDEYVGIVKAAWTSTDPISHKGKYYEFEGYEPYVKPLQQPGVPIYISGSSPGALGTAARYGDYHFFFGEPHSGTVELVSKVRKIATDLGGDAPRFGVRFTLILGDTDEEAWDRARRHVERLGPPGKPGDLVANTGAARLRQAAEAGELHDRALWMVAAGPWGGTLNALVGSPETVAEALLDYVRLGVTGFRVSGLDPFDDTRFIGRELIPRVREGARGLNVHED